MAAMRDGVHLQNLLQGIVAAVYKTNQTGVVVDRQAFVSPARPNGCAYQAVTHYWTMGAITDGTHTPTLMESADNITYTAVAMADIIVPAENLAPVDVNGNPTAAFGTQVANKQQKVGYNGLLRYTRLDVASSGATGATYSTAAVLTAPNHLPV